MTIADIVVIHIVMGTTSILSGGAALLFRKGEGPHRAAGTVFFLAMLAMAGSASIVAVLRWQTLNIVAATLTLYMVATAWHAAKRQDGRAGVFEFAAAFVALAVAANAFVLGSIGNKTADPIFYIFAGIAALSAVLDWSVSVRSISGAHRIARHLWRMCFAMFVATGSFFLGQQKIMPEWMRGSPLLFVPVVLVLGAMVFWLVRVWSGRKETA